MIAQAKPLPWCFTQKAVRPPLTNGRAAPLPRELKSGCFVFLDSFLRQTRHLGSHGNGGRMRWGELITQGRAVELRFGAAKDLVRIEFLGGIRCSYDINTAKQRGQIVVGAFVYAHQGVPSICGALIKNTYGAIPNKKGKGSPRVRHRFHRLWMTYAGSHEQLYRFEHGSEVGWGDQEAQRTSRVRDITWLETACILAMRYPSSRCLSEEMGRLLSRNALDWNAVSDAVSYMLVHEPHQVSFDAWERWEPDLGTRI